MVTEQGQTVWHGQLNGMAAQLHTVMAGKPVRRGGWDLKKGRPASMKSYVPAGSCYFLKPLGGASVADALGLHGQAIGRQTATGAMDALPVAYGAKTTNKPEYDNQ